MMGPSSQGKRRLRRFFLSALALTLAGTAAAARLPATTSHVVDGRSGRIAYTTEVGFVPLTTDDGKPAGQAFYTAYALRTGSPAGARRPLAFVWNGGPGSPSYYLQFLGLGPRVLPDGKTFSSNPDTPLPAVDMVFLDPIGTGFSRAADAEAAKRFFSTTGDAKATAQFIRTWTERHRAGRRPLFLIGESFGAYRAGGTAEILESQGVRVAGVVLISGGVASGPLIPPIVRTALAVPQRTAAALALGRSAPDLGSDRATVSRAATRWALETYLPALGHVDRLSAAEKDAIARDLARFTGFPERKIDRRTLTIDTDAFLLASSPKPGQPLYRFDMRKLDGLAFDRMSIERYYGELGAGTTLPYWGLDDTTPDPLRADGKSWVRDFRWPDGRRWGYAYAEPWLPAAMRINPRLKVWVAAGLYDASNSCAENDVVAAMLEPDLAANYTFRCYPGGHMMYEDPEARRALSDDLGRFITATAAQLD